MSCRFRAIDIANFYVQLSNNLSDTIDNLKINKLLFYTQAHSLCRFNKPIFYDVIQAWDYGPLVKDVFNTFKACGKDPIKEATDFFDESMLSPEELELLIDVYETYGKYTGLALMKMTHAKGAPWDQVYVQGQNEIIPLDLIKEYYSNKECRLDSFQLNYDKLPIVSVLPKEWDSEEDRIYDV